jgi:hypothetical protein
MKFYRMKNGDIVTDLHISTRRANALKGTRMWDAGNKTLCCDERVYYDGVTNRLNTAATAVLLGQISYQLKTGTPQPEPEPAEEEITVFGVPKSWLLKIQGLFS